VTDLVWDGCVNIRDVGGLPVAGGGTTQPGRLVRADNVRGLTDAGWRALVDHGVHLVVDLRFPEELAEDPPGDPPVKVVHIPLLGANRTAEWQAEVDAEMDRATGLEEYLVASYLGFLDRYHHRFGRVFQALADAPDGPVVVHCLGGKDRTGLVSALALRLAGVSIADVAGDYARSGPNLAELDAEWVGAAADEADRRRRGLMVGTPAAVMRDVLEELERRHRSVEAYLAAAGVGDDALERVRRRLLEP
jgi:protein tyrosine/serine phosphatase